MHPAFYHWWKSARQGGGCGVSAGCGPSGGGWGGGGYWAAGEDDGEFGPGGGGAFGVRRPLRFLAYKLQLDDTQVGQLAQILSELKTERAQSAVDHRRTVSAFADAVAAESFDAARAAEGAELRLKSAERLRDAVVKALGAIHALLRPDQRARLAYLIRTGTLSL
jgi:Spy/CpxP family protein refolding chaperone